MSSEAIAYHALKSIRFPRYSDFDSATQELAPSIKTIERLRDELEKAQARAFGVKERDGRYETDPDNGDAFWNRFLRMPGNDAFTRWREAFQASKPEMFFLGHPASKLPAILGAALGGAGCKRPCRAEKDPPADFEKRGQANFYRVPSDSWKEQTKDFRLLVMEHVGPYFHRPHLMSYDIHEHFREYLPDDGTPTLIWMVVPGRRGRFFEARAEFLRRCRCPDLGYHQFSDTVRTGLYGLIDAHVFLTRVMVGDANSEGSAPPGGPWEFDAQQLQRLWALQWDNDDELNALARECMTAALDPKQRPRGQFSGAALYTERHFFWFVEKKRSRISGLPASRSSRLRAIGTLCACTDEVQRLLPDTEFWGCTVAHTVMDAKEDADDDVEPPVLSDPIDLPQRINDTLEWGYHWPFIFDRTLRPEHGPYSGGGGCLVPNPWFASFSRPLEVEGALMRSTDSVSFLAFPRFFQSRMVTPLPPLSQADGVATRTPLAQPLPAGPNSSLAHIYRLREKSADEFTRVRVLFSGERFSAKLSRAQNGLRFPEVLRRSLDASRAYSITVADLKDPADRTAILAHLAEQAPHLDEFRRSMRSGSVWVFSVGYSHRRSRNHDPDFVSPPDLRAAFFGILFVPDLPGAFPSATPDDQLAEYIELHKGRLAANIERILAKMAAEMVEEHTWRDQMIMSRATLMMDAARSQAMVLRNIQRAAIDGVAKMGLAMDTPHSVLFDTRHLAVELFRHGTIWINPKLVLTSSHNSYGVLGSRFVLAYFLVRSLAPTADLSKLTKQEELRDLATVALTEAFTEPSRQFLSELNVLLGARPDTTADESKDVMSELLSGTVMNSVAQNWLEESEDIPPEPLPEREGIASEPPAESAGDRSVRAKMAVDRLKMLLFTPFKITSAWNPEVVRAALCATARDTEVQPLGSSPVWELGRDLPWTHGDWVDALLSVARVFFGPRKVSNDDLVPFVPKGQATVTFSDDTYTIALDKSKEVDERIEKLGSSAIADSYEAALRAFEQGLAIGLDVRLGGPTIGDFSNGFRLLGATFRFVPQEDSLRTEPAKLKWVRSPVQRDIRTDETGDRSFSMRLWNAVGRLIVFNFRIQERGKRLEFELAAEEFPPGRIPVFGKQADQVRASVPAAAIVPAPQPGFAETALPAPVPAPAAPSTTEGYIEFWDHSRDDIEGCCRLRVEAAVARAQEVLGIKLTWGWKCVPTREAMHAREKQVRAEHPAKKVRVYIHFHLHKIPYWNYTKELPRELRWLPFSYDTVYPKGKTGGRPGIDNLAIIVEQDNAVEHLAGYIIKQWSYEAR